MPLPLDSRDWPQKEGMDLRMAPLIMAVEQYRMIQQFLLEIKNRTE